MQAEAWHRKDMPPPFFYEGPQRALIQRQRCPIGSLLLKGPGPGTRPGLADSISRACGNAAAVNGTAGLVETLERSGRIPARAWGMFSKSESSRLPKRSQNCTANSLFADALLANALLANALRADVLCADVSSLDNVWMLLRGVGDKDEDQGLKLNRWHRRLIAKSMTKSITKLIVKLIAIGNQLRAQGGAAHGLYPREHCAERYSYFSQICRFRCCFQGFGWLG